MSKQTIDGTATQIELIYREQGDKLWRSLMFTFGDSEVASDAVAESFAQAIRRGAALTDPGAWVWKAAYRIAAGEMKRMRSGTELPEDLEYEMPEPAVDLFRALQKISVKQRAAVVLGDYAGYTNREIATIIGSTPSAVGVHLHRARRALRRYLEEVPDA